MSDNNDDMLYIASDYSSSSLLSTEEQSLFLMDSRSPRESQYQNDSNKVDKALDVNPSCEFWNVAPLVDQLSGHTEQSHTTTTTTTRDDSLKTSNDDFLLEEEEILSDGDWKGFDAYIGLIEPRERPIDEKQQDTMDSDDDVHKYTPEMWVTTTIDDGIVPCLVGQRKECLPAPQPYRQIGECNNSSQRISSTTLLRIDADHCGKDSYITNRNGGTYTGSTNPVSMRDNNRGYLREQQQQMSKEYRRDSLATTIVPNSNCTVLEYNTVLHNSSHLGGITEKSRKNSMVHQESTVIRSPTTTNNVFSVHLKSILLEEMQRTIKETCSLNTRVLENWKCSLQDLLGFPALLTSLCKDKFGSRYVQKMCEDKTATCYDIRQLIEKVIVPHGVNLCQHQFGNHVIQKLLEITCEQTRFDNETEDVLCQQVLNWLHMDNKKKPLVNKTNKSGVEYQKQEMRRNGLRILESVFIGHILELSMNSYSCRVVQRIIVGASYPATLKILFLKEICSRNKRNETELITFFVDQHGNHVLQKIIERVPNQFLDWIIYSIQGNVFQFSVHIYGCRVIQHVLAYCSSRQRNIVVGELLDKASDLCRDKYGNYVVQKWIGVETDECTLMHLVNRLCADIKKLVCDKFASNVIEQCLRILKGEPRRTIIDCILYSHTRPLLYSTRSHPNGSSDEDEDDSNRPGIQRKQEYLTVGMLRNEYGNYVIQTLLQIDLIDCRRELVNQIVTSIPIDEILNYSWKNQVLGKIFGDV